MQEYDIMRAKDETKRPVNGYHVNIGCILGRAFALALVILWGLIFV